jgi:hypothetical protein
VPGAEYDDAGGRWHNHAGPLWLWLWHGAPRLLWRLAALCTGTGYWLVLAAGCWLLIVVLLDSCC